MAPPRASSCTAARSCRGALESADRLLDGCRMPDFADRCRVSEQSCPSRRRGLQHGAETGRAGFDQRGQIGMGFGGAVRGDTVGQPLRRGARTAAPVRAAGASRSGRRWGGVQPHGNAARQGPVRCCLSCWTFGRSERIRTSGPCLPKTVLYQAELHSDARSALARRRGDVQALCRMSARARTQSVSVSVSTASSCRISSGTISSARRCVALSRILGATPS